jgi:glucokinase
MELIAGDIGGTKSWLAWATHGAQGTQQLRYEQVYPSAQFDSAEALLQRFAADAASAAVAPAAPPDRMVLALPGPLNTQCMRLTNLDWTLDRAVLQSALAIPDIRFINDFQAAAAGVATLTETDMVALNPCPAEPGGVRAITGAGTGLGLAYMLADAAGRYRSHDTEGGHIDFAPANAMQARLLAYLRTDYGHVSWERVVSGSAMNDLYRFCCAERGLPLPLPARPLDGAALAQRAEAGDVAAMTALDLFVEVYGAWVGNVALLYRPRGGLYIAGGVATHMLERMRSPRFMAAAADKGRMRGVVERTPIFLVTCKRLGVQGALAEAQ